MARQSGPKKLKKRISLSEDLCQKIDTLLTPLGEAEPTFGEWAKLAERLLWEHWRKLPEEKRKEVEARIDLRRKKETQALMTLTD
jgi:hypothetical protein